MFPESYRLSPGREQVTSRHAGAPAQKALGHFGCWSQSQLGIGQRRNNLISCEVILTDCFDNSGTSEFWRELIGQGAGIKLSFSE